MGEENDKMTCEFCCFFEERDDIPGFDGDCRFSAPECGTRCARWPEVKLHWWCADFEQVDDE